MVLARRSLTREARLNVPMWLTAIVAGAAALPGVLAGQSMLVKDSVSSPGLASNMLGDSPVRRVFVYLPPSYHTTPARRYPVLYLLHGATSVPEEWPPASDPASGDQGP